MTRFDEYKEKAQAEGRDLALASTEEVVRRMAICVGCEFNDLASYKCMKKNIRLNALTRLVQGHCPEEKW